MYNVVVVVVSLRYIRDRHLFKLKDPYVVPENDLVREVFYSLY